MLLQDHLIKLTDEQVHFSLSSKLQGQINVVRKGLPYLRPNGVFVITGGFLAYKSQHRKLLCNGSGLTPDWKDLQKRQLGAYRRS